MRFCIFLLSFLLLTAAGYAHNGKVSYAYPVHSITIDGDLSDWPPSLPHYPFGEGAASDRDFSATFRTGYNLDEQALYIAMEVIDDSHVPGNREGNVWGRKQDRHLLYIDARHTRESGSGVVLFFGSTAGIDLWKAENSWDPPHSYITSRNAELAVTRTGNRTTYEWKIQLGDAVQPYTSLGMDHEIQDADAERAETATHAWGPGGLKNRVPSRLGDVVLVPEETALAESRGTVTWGESTDEPLPDAVTITSDLHTNLWTQAAADSAGAYTTTLPEGTYRVRPAYETTNALQFTDKKRIDMAHSARLHVTGKGISVADTLRLQLYDRPDFLMPQEGLLFSYKSRDAARVDNFVRTYMEYYNIPGVQLALIKDGELVYNKGFGTKNTITGTPVTTGTIFETASISKAVFAFAVHRLAEKDVLDLDRPLHTYLPFSNITGDERSKKMTARHVLSHQSGLPNWAWGGPFGWKNGGDIRLQFKPGEGYGYSGEGYEYLKRVIEEITGKEIETIMKEEVYHLFDMNDTSLTQTHAVVRRAALGHLSDTPVFWSLESRPWVAGSMYSTTDDLARFMTGLMKGVGLTEAGYRELFTAEVENKDAVLRFFGGGTVYHSLGFEIQDSPFGRFVHHGGNNGDFQGRFAMLPDQRLGFIMLANNNAGLQLDLALQQFLFTGDGR